MWLVVGLGNPGPKYSMTRHNVGFLCIDQWLRGFGNPAEKNQHKAIVAKFQYNSQAILTAKPQTYMNLSGDSVQALMHFYKIDIENLIVVHDEIDLPFSQLKLQRDRGHGGNNGIRDIHAKLGRKDYTRLRIGVGRPPNPNMSPADHVLQNFAKAEIDDLGDTLNLAGDALCRIIDEGFEKAATWLNSKGS